MIVLSWQAWLTIVLALASVSTARVGHRSSLHHHHDIIDNLSALQTRQDSGGSSECTLVPDCSPSSCGGSICTTSKKRSLPIIGSNLTDVDPEEQAHLFKRLLRPVRQSNLIGYLQNQNNDPNLVKLCPANAGGYDTPSYCVQYSFSNAPVNPATGQLLIGTGDTELTGCTVLTVVSSKGVYMCHFWQDLNYVNPGREGRPDRPVLGFQPVLNLIAGQGDRRWAVGPALDTSLFTGEGTNTWAFITTPRAAAALDDPRRYHYVAEYQQLVALLTTLVPGIGIMDYNYYFVQPYRNYYQGSVLFEYDVNADGSGNPDWRLWVEASNEMGTALGQNPG
ncbi:hypothetical protein IFM61606_09827 [Aspergillus udagawae]|nr:hypothetical protein IFM61606_09827 [Aspergillus udagawae]